MVSGGIKLDLKIILKGGLTLAGIILMALASILDAVNNTPNKFSSLFWTGFLALCLGGFFIWKFGHD